MLSKLSQDVDGIQMVKMASKHVRTLVPQVCMHMIEFPSFFQVFVLMTEASEGSVHFRG